MFACLSGCEPSETVVGVLINLLTPHFDESPFSDDELTEKANAWLLQPVTREQEQFIYWACGARDYPPPRLVIEGLGEVAVLPCSKEEGEENYMDPETGDHFRAWKLAPIVAYDELGRLRPTRLFMSSRPVPPHFSATKFTVTFSNTPAVSFQ